MSAYLAMVRKVEALQTPGSVLGQLLAELQDARVALERRTMIEREVTPAARRRWPEHERFRIAERDYKKHLREVQQGRSSP